MTKQENPNMLCIKSMLENYGLVILVLEWLIKLAFHYIIATHF